MNELLEFLMDKCNKGLKEAAENCVDPHLRHELASIQAVLDQGKSKISPSTMVEKKDGREIKDELYDLISTLTDITISYPHNRPAQILCSPFQIRPPHKTQKKRLRLIKAALQNRLGQPTDSSTHDKKENGRLVTRFTRGIREIMTFSKGKNSSNQKGEDRAVPEPHSEGTSDHSSNEKKDISGPETLPEIELEMIRGFDDKLKQIEGSLNIQNRGHIEIGILGMCGSGKTTLAQLVYYSKKLDIELKPRIWVNLPKKPTSNVTYVEQILRVILGQCGEDKGGKGEEVDLAKCSQQQLLRMIRTHLLGKSYLLVLDGVWDADMGWYFELGKALDWQYKNGDFGNDGGKSAVIITTRLEEPAKTMVGISALHRLDPRYLDQHFSKEICWSIFIDQVKRGGKIEEGNASLQELKNDIEEQCEGLPLAAVTLAEIIPKQIREQKEQDAAGQAGSSVEVPA